MSLEDQIAEYGLESLPDMGQITILDVGANWGTFCRAALKRWPLAMIRAYEPQPQNFARLSAIARPRHGRIVAQQSAVVWPKVSERVRLFAGLSHTEWSTHDDVRWPEVRQDTSKWIDVHALDASELPPCDVLKIDTEGAEVEILAGYKHLATVTVLLVEAHAVAGDLGHELMQIHTMAADAGLAAKPTLKPNVLRFVRDPWQHTRTSRFHCTITSTVKNAPQDVRRCIKSVRQQTVRNFQHVLIAVDEPTYTAAVEAADGDPRIEVRRSDRPEMQNLLPLWAALPHDEIVVWLDGDDQLLPHALARVIEAHEHGAWVTYGQFSSSSWPFGFARQVGAWPRQEGWQATHLKTFRAGLVKQMRETDFLEADGSYAGLVCDQRVMLGVLELADVREAFIPDILYLFNEGHSFMKNASGPELSRELGELGRVRAMAPYAPTLSPSPNAWPGLDTNA
jgi:FkbM family methyltransferase